jgi:isoquinoline 1-oxidoreductase subunit alpha
VRAGIASNTAGFPSPEKSMAEVTVRWTLNGRPARYQGDGEQPLLWHLRDERQLPGTKYGCGIGACGACTVHVEGRATTACTVPMRTLAGRQVVTIEGLAPRGGLHAVQRAWIEHNVPQCGYCQAGQMMAAAALLAARQRPSEAEVDEAMRPVLCRCGTYLRVRAAVMRAAELAAGSAA